MTKTRTCPECGGAMSVSHEDYRYDESGLSNVVLTGIEVRRCASCKTVQPVIGNIEGLHRALARSIVEKPARLAGEEVRYLRTYLGFRGVDFARVMGVTPEAVSRWENDKDPIGPSTDRALRLLVLTQKPLSDYTGEELNRLLESIGEDDNHPLHLRVERRPGVGWEGSPEAA